MSETLTKWAAAAVLTIGAAARFFGSGASMLSRMNWALRNLISASILLLFTAPSALAGSVTQPGDTMGSASGLASPPGFYATNQANGGCITTTPRSCFSTEVPLLAWVTPWKIAGGSLVFPTGPTTLVNVIIRHTHHATALFNPFLATALTWDLGDGWGFTYLLGGYFRLNSPVAYSSYSLNQRFALSYTANGWNLTTNLIWGINFDQVTGHPQGTPCPLEPALGCNPNFINDDLTATKKFGKWELGAIGFYATDVSTPISSYRRQSKAAMGGLVGYSFGPAILQVYVTTDVYEKNYGGRDTRLWTRITIPLGNPPPPPDFRPIGF